MIHNCVSDPSHIYHYLQKSRLRDRWSPPSGADPPVPRCPDVPWLGEMDKLASYKLLQHATLHIVQWNQRIIPSSSFSLCVLPITESSLQIKYSHICVYLKDSPISSPYYLTIGLQWWLYAKFGKDFIPVKTEVQFTFIAAMVCFRSYFIHESQYSLWERIV